MKKIGVIIALFLVVSLVQAIPVSESSAWDAAEFHLQIHNKTDHVIREVSILENAEGLTTAYIHHLDPIGFIIVAADTDLPPVVGYSFRDEFLADQENGLGYKFVQQDMSNRIAAREMISNEILAGNARNWDNYLSHDLSGFQQRDRSIYPPEGHTNTEGWVDMLWDQGFPWNSYCPYDDVNGGRCVTGCVATALSMVLAYHEYIGAVNFTDSDDYSTNYEGFYVYIDNNSEEKDFPNFPTLNSYMPDIQEHFAGVDPMDNHIKAALNFAAGVSVHMKYSNVASGAQVYYPGHDDTRSALLNKFGYDSAEGVNGSSSQLFDLFEEDMMDGRPIIMAILDSQEGHAILVDGWNTGDNTFHLNFGWSGSYNGWYSLPYGMPQGFNVINNAVVNIEAGGTLFDLYAIITAPGGATPANADIEFRGTRLYEGNLDQGGAFSYEYMHEGTYQVTISYENPTGGYYYKSATYDLNEDNYILSMELDDYTEITGSISGISDLENAVISFYNEEGELVSNGTTDSSGNYTIAGLLPGEYIATASWGDNYYDMQTVEVTATQQNFDFDLLEYPYNYSLSYCGSSGEMFHLIPNVISCAIKLTEDELTGFEGTAFNKVEFKSPIAQSDGELWAQIWINGSLVSEKAISSFEYGENITVLLDNFVQIDPALDYFVGFKVNSENGDLAWFDSSPRVTGKGAWFRINGWAEVTSSFDHNFMITAHVVSETVDKEESEINPAITMLGNNYPNPFNPETNISFTLAEAGYVTLEIYNLKGQKIKTLAKDHYDKGTHILHWNGTDDSGKSTASGVYLYKMKNGRYTSTKKMILMK